MATGTPPNKRPCTINWPIAPAPSKFELIALASKRPMLVCRSCVILPKAIPRLPTLQANVGG